MIPAGECPAAPLAVTFQMSTRGSSVRTALSLAAVHPGVVADGAKRWTGAGLIPARGVGYWSTTIPLVRVELDHGTLTVRVRPAWLGKIMSARTISATTADGLQILRVRDRAAYQGIEFRPLRRSSFYFYTQRREHVLGALSEAGFAISSEPGRERPAWYQPDDD